MDLFFRREAAVGTGPAVEAVSDGVVPAAVPAVAVVEVIGAVELEVAPPRLPNSEDVGAAVVVDVEVPAEVVAFGWPREAKRLPAGALGAGATDVAVVEAADAVVEPDPKFPKRLLVDAGA
jgi:hypothetical protein